MIKKLSLVQELLQETIIKRETYLQSIQKYWDAKLIKVITGMRRVGKSSLLKTILQQAVALYHIPYENIFYINKELPFFNNIKTYDDLEYHFQSFLSTIVKDKKILIAIDEIQDIQEWEKFINGYLAQYGQKVEIFITGSNSLMLSSELSTYLTGRYIEFEVFPLSLTEYALFSQQPITKPLFLDYLQYGGLPGIFYMQKEEEVIFNYLQGIYATIILKDIVKYFGVRNIQFFEDLYNYIFANIGNVVSAKNISDYLKSQHITISPNVVLDYLSYGNKVYLLDIVKSVNPDTKKYFEIYNKYYVGDIGLRNALVGYHFDRDIGKILENYAYLELKRKGYTIKIGRLANGKEIDFIAEKRGIIKYFQICYLPGNEETMAREYAPLEEMQDNWEKYLVSFDDIDHGTYKGIKHINVMDLHKVV